MKIVACLVFMILLTVVANLLLKQGAMSSERVFFGVYSVKSILGFAAFAASGLIYAIVLRWLPLNVAQSIATLQFVAVILASAFFLSESIPAMRWVGIALILGGVLLVSTTVGHAGSKSSQSNTGVRLDG